jgi:perosamine synthetase
MITPSPSHSRVYGRPALLGGEPLVAEPFPPPHAFGDEEAEAAARVVRSGLLSGFSGSAGDGFLGGPEVRRLEEAFAARFEVRRAVAMNSATSALEAGLTALGVGFGDEVVVPPLTMSATATAVLRVNAIPVFADVDPETFTIDPASIASALTPRTRAIVAVDLFGQPAALDDLRALCDEHDLRLLEDNSQAPGAQLDGRWAGTIGDAGVFSLNQHKTVHCGEGGVLVTNDDRVAFRAQLCRNHGEVVMDDLVRADPAQRYEALLGSNFRLVEPLAAVASVQLRKLDALNAHRIRLAEQLTERLAELDAISPPALQPGATHVYFVYAMRYDAERAGLSREQLVRALAAENLTLLPGYTNPIYRYPLYQQAPDRCAGPFAVDKPDYPPGLCPVAERLHDRELLLTDVCRHPLTTEHVDLLVEGIAKVLAAAGDIADAS